MILGLFEGLGLETFVILFIITILLRSPVNGLLSLPSNLFPLLAAVAPVLMTSAVLMLTRFGACLLFCTMPTIRVFSGTACLAIRFAFVSAVIVLPTLLCCLADLVERRSLRSGRSASAIGSVAVPT